VLFDFGGAGADTCAVGVSLTHLSIEVIQLTLSGVGTEKVALGLNGTGCVPLLGTEDLTQEQKRLLESIETAGFVLLAGALMYAIPQEFAVRRCSSCTVQGCLT
jgi:hypothetical protein